ncbi:hypothetical protein ENBRE01_2318, partial [Enteropsectra breve]
MLYNGFDIVASLIAFSKCMPSDDSDDKTQNEENTRVSTNFSFDIIEHDGTMTSFYEKFVKCLESNLEVRSVYLYDDFEIKVYTPETLPIIVNNFNLSAATEYASEEINLDSDVELKNTKKHVKFLLEMVVVLERLFMYTNNEYNKLAEAAAKSIQHHKENISRLRQGQKIKDVSNNPLTIEEISDVISAANLNSKATKQLFCNRLYSIFKLMNSIRNTISSIIAESNATSCSKLRLVLPDELYMNYESALQYILREEGYEKFVNMETTAANSPEDFKIGDPYKIEIPIKQEPLVDKVALRDGSNGYYYEDFYNDLETEIGKHYYLIQGMPAAMLKKLIKKDKVIVDNYNLTAAFHAAVDKIKNNGSAEQESMVIIGNIVTILHRAFGLHKTQLEEIQEDNSKNKSNKVMRQCYSNLNAISELMKEISKYIGTLINGQSHSNGYLDCCSSHSYLNRRASEAMAFLKQHPGNKDFIENSDESDNIEEEASNEGELGNKPS